jgi:hypothetical protein
MKVTLLVAVLPAGRCPSRWTPVAALTAAPLGPPHGLARPGPGWPYRVSPGSPASVRMSIWVSARSAGTAASSRTMNSAAHASSQLRTSAAVPCTSFPPRAGCPGRTVPLRSRPLPWRFRRDRAPGPGSTGRARRSCGRARPDRPRYARRPRGGPPPGGCAARRRQSAGEPGLQRLRVARRVAKPVHRAGGRGPALVQQ